MFVYLFHDMFINILLATIIFPFKLSFASSIIIVVFGAEFLSILAYKVVDALVSKKRVKEDVKVEIEEQPKERQEILQ